MSALLNPNTVLIFQANGVLFCMDAHQVNAVVDFQPLTRLPGMPKVMAGVFRWQGEVTTVIDLRKLLHFPERSPGNCGCIITSRIHGAIFGFWVDSVEDVIETHDLPWQALPTSCTTLYMDRTLCLDEKMVILLNLDQLLERDIAAQDWPVLGQQIRQALEDPNLREPDGHPQEPGRILTDVTGDTISPTGIEPAPAFTSTARDDTPAAETGANIANPGDLVNFSTEAAVTNTDAVSGEPVSSAGSADTADTAVSAVSADAGVVANSAKSAGPTGSAGSAGSARAVASSASDAPGTSTALDSDIATATEFDLGTGSPATVNTDLTTGAQEYQAVTAKDKVHLAPGTTTATLASSSDITEMSDSMAPALAAADTEDVHPTSDHADTVANTMRAAVEAHMPDGTDTASAVAAQPADPDLPDAANLDPRPTHDVDTAADQSLKIDKLTHAASESATAFEKPAHATPANPLTGIGLSETSGDSRIGSALEPTAGPGQTPVHGTVGIEPLRIQPDPAAPIDSHPKHSHKQLSIYDTQNGAGDNNNSALPVSSAHLRMQIHLPTVSAKPPLASARTSETVSRHTSAEIAGARFTTKKARPGLSPTGFGLVVLTGMLIAILALQYFEPTPAITEPSATLVLKSETNPVDRARTEALYTALTNSGKPDTDISISEVNNGTDKRTFTIDLSEHRLVIERPLTMTTSSTANASTLTTTDTMDHGKFTFTHRVRKGDTLWNIAKTYLNNPYLYPELARVSEINNPDLIFPGDVVRMIEKEQTRTPVMQPAGG